MRDLSVRRGEVQVLGGNLGTGSGEEDAGWEGTPGWRVLGC